MRLLVVLGFVLSACSSAAVPMAEPAAPPTIEPVAPPPSDPVASGTAAPIAAPAVEPPALLRVTVTREERSRDSSTYVTTYVMHEGHLTRRAATTRGRPAASHEASATLSAESVAELLDLARREGLASDDAPADPPLTEAGVRTRYDVQLDGHRSAAVEWELAGRPPAPVPDPRVLAIRRLVDALDQRL